MSGEWFWKKFTTKFVKLNFIVLFWFVLIRLLAMIRWLVCCTFCTDTRNLYRFVSFLFAHMPNDWHDDDWKSFDKKQLLYEPNKKMLSKIEFRFYLLIFIIFFLKIIESNTYMHSNCQRSSPLENMMIFIW